MRIHNKSLACRESLGSVDENPIRLNRGVDAKPTPRVMQGSALGFWGIGPFQTFRCFIRSLRGRWQGYQPESITLIGDSIAGGRPIDRRRL